MKLLLFNSTSLLMPTKCKCGVCAIYTNSTKEEQIKLADEYELHLSKKGLSHDQKTKINFLKVIL